jgi:RsiW-degrading membrane proteinase PrsW (M82 family)
MQQPTRFEWLSLGQLLLSGLGFLLFALGGVVLLLMGVAGLAGSNLVDPAQVLPFFSLMWICGLICLLVAPSIVLSLMRLSGKPRPGWQWKGSFRAASWAMLVWPFAIAGGTWVSRTGTLDWLFLPPLQILAVALPLWWLIEFGRRGLSLPGSSPQRSWGVLSSGLLVSLPVAFVVELLAIGLMLLVFIIWLSSQPGATEQITLLAQRLANAGSDPEVLLRIMRPLAMNPSVLVTVLLGTSGLFPLIEELIKPLGLWVLAGRKLTPAEGFLFGLLSGAAFALLESLGTIANPSGQEWLAVVLGRTGTGMLHTVTTGLMGWALASAWQDGRYLRLAGTYLLAVGLHGLWNLFGIVLALPDLFGTASVTGVAVVLLRLGQVAPYVLVVLTGMLFSILLVSNRRLRAESSKIDPS